MIRLAQWSLGALFLLVFVPRPVSADDEFRFTEARHKGGELKYIQGIPVLSVQGTSEEIGEQVGTLVGQAARPMQHLPKQILEKHGLGVGWPALAATARRMMQNAPESYRKEMDAALKHSPGVEADMIYVANAMIELRRVGGCSALLVEPQRSKTGKMLFGRNFDFDPFGVLHRYGLVAVVRPKDKIAFVSVGFPGLTGVVSGMNEKGLALATLDVYSSADGSPMFDNQGVPLSLTFRRILEECATVEEAQKLLESGRHTTWMNLAVCDTKRAVVFEITTRKVVMRPSDWNLVACTNHFRAKGLYTGERCARYDRLEAYWKLDKVGLADVAKALHQVNQGSWTLQTMIFEPESLKLHLSMGRGPASARPLVELEMGEFLKAGGEARGR
ncbi:MAG: linear amide C-N hydrolase [Planctomycetia bacterium]|nr:linear amide C-N hydrolase [Planctomycetia bacterium]